MASFDASRDLHVSARTGATMLFDGRSASVLPEGPQIAEAGQGWRAELPGQLALQLEPLSDAADLGGVRAWVCRASGEIGGRRVQGLGTVSETRSAPSWEELDALRTVSVLVDEEHAFLALARRPRGARGHGQELVNAYLWREGSLLPVEDARISTVYDGEGRQRSAGLELWLAGEEWPRRGSGTVTAGSSLQLEGLRVHAAVFRWRLEGREGVGGYELMVRSEQPVPA